MSDSPAPRDRIAAILDPEVFEATFPKSAERLAQLQWSYRRVTALEGADRMLAAFPVLAAEPTTAKPKAGDELINDREIELANIYETELEWFDTQDWNGISRSEYHAVLARHLAMHDRLVSAALAPEPAEHDEAVELLRIITDEFWLESAPTHTPRRDRLNELLNRIAGMLEASPEPSHERPPLDPTPYECYHPDTVRWISREAAYEQGCVVRFAPGPEFEQDQSMYRAGEER